MENTAIVDKMVAIAEKYNFEAMQSSGIDINQAMMMAEHVRPQLYKIQKDILDALVNENIITINNT